jgi:OmpA-OmpF porin, OOP family
MAMHRTIIRAFLAAALVAAVLGSARAHAEDFLNQDWVLDPRLSSVYMQTVKANAVFETHQFMAVEGHVSKEGEASVTIALASIETGIDLRNVRMRFLLFETFKFPHADIAAKLDKAELRGLLSQTRVSYPLKLTLSMHGIVKEMETQVWITRIDASTIAVATKKPIIVTAESLGLADGIAKLSEAVGGTPIASAASITFDLVFAMGNGKPEPGATGEKKGTPATTSAITAEACETTLSVISRRGAIYFRAASAELDQESAPLLDSVADIANRCPSVKIAVEGHTDNIGSKSLNQRLSEQRARSVAAYLIAKGVAAARIQSTGYGDTRPEAANDTKVDRGKNRRIEFKVRKE